MWTTRSRAWEQELVTECEAFLTGRFPEYLVDHGRLVPVWAQVNKLAHGSEDDIEADAAGHDSPVTASGGTQWQAAMSFLAQELISEATRRRVSVAELQRSILVPLELELFKTRLRSTMTLPIFVSTVRGALVEQSVHAGRDGPAR